MADEQGNREEKGGEDRRGLIRDRRGNKGGQSGENDRSRNDQYEQERGSDQQGRRNP